MILGNATLGLRYGSHAATLDAGQVMALAENAGWSGAAEPLTTTDPRWGAAFGLDVFWLHLHELFFYGGSPVKGKQQETAASRVCC